jgi:hypothetical protein
MELLISSGVLTLFLLVGAFVDFLTSRFAAASGYRRPAFLAEPPRRQDLDAKRVPDFMPAYDRPG